MNPITRSISFAGNSLWISGPISCQNGSFSSSRLSRIFLTSAPALSGTVTDGDTADCGILFWTSFFDFFFPPPALVAALGLPKPPAMATGVPFWRRCGICAGREGARNASERFIRSAMAHAIAREVHISPFTTPAPSRTPNEEYSQDFDAKSGQLEKHLWMDVGA